MKCDSDNRCYQRADVRGKAISEAALTSSKQASIIQLLTAMKLKKLGRVGSTGVCNTGSISMAAFFFNAERPLPHYPEDPFPMEKKEHNKFAEPEEYIQFLYALNLQPSQSLQNMINHYRFFLSSLPWPQLISPCSTVIWNRKYEGGRFRGLIALQ